MRALFIACALFSGNLLAATSCTFDSVTIPILGGLSLVAREAALPTMISNSWHEISGVKGSCAGAQAGTGSSYFTIIIRPGATVTAQEFTFQGGVYKIINTSIKGVGMIVATQLRNSGYYRPLTLGEYVPDGGVVGVTPVDSMMSYRVRFVATEILQPGIINIPATILVSHGIHIRFESKYYGWGYIWAQAATLNVTYPSCKLSVPGAVKLPKLDIGSLVNAKATAGETPFSIDLDCGAGTSSVSAKYTLTDISFPTNTSSALGLAKVPDSASGFAIEVLENGLPVGFGPDSSTIGTINQRDFGNITSAGGRIRKSFTARYIRATPPFVAGKVNAGMTITMSYQ